ncbi:MAG: hypothetical protein AAB925_01040 [Patescibacteria group bacterium]
MAKKKITIEGLALMIGKGFSGMDKNFKEIRGEMDKNFKEVREELKGVKKQLTGVVYRHEFEELETRVKELEGFLAMPGRK